MKTYTGWLKKSALSLAIASAGLSAVPAMAQIDSASLRGTIANEDTTKAGVEVVAVDVARGYTFTTTTQADGSYTFVGLKPGEYRIRVAGASEGEEITLRVGQNANLNFDISDDASAPGLEEVIVTAQRIEDFQGGGIGTTITPELMQRLPQVTRNFLSFAELAPGVQFEQGADGSTSIRGGAQHQRGVNVFLDGVSQKDYVLKGGVTGQDSSRGNPFPQSAVGQYKVITQNYKAEYAHVGSTAITAVTRSGTNEFHGDVFYDYTSDDFRASTPSEDAAGEKAKSSQKQYGLTFSGPIIEDKLHFFVAYEKKNNKDLREVEARNQPADLPAEYAAMTGTKLAPFEEDLFFGKIDWAISDSQALEASIKYREESELTGFQGVNTKSYGSSKDQEDTRVQVKHTFTGDGWQNEARVTYEDSFWNPRPISSGFGQVLENSANQRILAVGAGVNYQNKGQEGLGFKDDVTFTDLQWFGDHVIKTGVSYKQVTLKTIQRNPYNPQYHYNVEFNGPGTFDLVQPYKVEWGVGIEGTTNKGALESENKQFGIYVQDDWYVNDRLTLNLGVRWDYEETPSYKNFVTPQEVVDTLHNWDNINQGNAGYDIDNWISTGDNRDYFTGAWAPRLGFSYDLVADGQHQLFGGYGRSYDRNQFDFLSQEQINGTFGKAVINFQGDPNNPCTGDNCVAWDPSYLTPEGLAALQTSVAGNNTEIKLVNNDLKTPYSDQFSIGVRSTWGDWNTEVSLSRVLGKDGFNWYLGNRREDGNFFAPGDIWGTPWGFQPDGYSNLILSANDLETEANSLYVKLERPHYDNWGVNIAYTYTDAKENWLYSSHGVYAYPSVDWYGWRQSVGVPEHRIVAVGTYDLPWGIFLSGKWTLSSAAPEQYTNRLNGPGQFYFDRIKPDDGGFSQLDVSLSKKFATDMLVSGSEFRVRLDVLNLLNTHNWRNFDLNAGDINGVNENFGQHGLNLAGPSRTAKLSVGWSW